MKIRTGFVSNSSTSSFICDVCGDMYAERDIGLEEAGMFQCIAGHTFCECHKLDPDDVYDLPLEDKKELVMKYYEAKHFVYSTHEKFADGTATDEEFSEAFDEIYDPYDRYDIPSEFCPVCQFESATDYDIVSWFLATHSGMTKKKLLTMWKADHGTYQNFRKAIGQKDED